MERNFTESIRNGYYDLAEKETDEIWEALGINANTISDRNKWQRHYSEVVSRYRVSSRFAFMRVLFEKATGCSPFQISDEALAAGFSVVGIGDFTDITITHANDMDAAELDKYKRLLLQRADENNPGHHAETIDLVDRALSLPAAGSKSILKRDEVIRLGHLVDLSVDDMQFLLLRVLGDNEVAFKYSSSEDIIDIYGFISHFTLDETEELKQWYADNTAGVKKEKYEDKSTYYTKDIADSIETSFASMGIGEFRSWLLQRAPYLDLRPKTARKVYMNLAAYAFILTDGMQTDMADMVGENFYEDMQMIAQTREYHKYSNRIFLNNSKPDRKKCEEAVAKIVYENAYTANGFSSLTESSELYYHVPYVDKNGKITVRGKLNQGSKQRIVDILMDKEVPTKSDMLYLLWYIANFHWIDQTGSAREKTFFLDDFLSAASCLLEAAMLPGFYPPSVLEETLMLSIVNEKEDLSPAMTYEAICSSFTQKGTTRKHPGSKAKTAEEKREIVEYYYANLSAYPTKIACKKACAQHFGISKASVDNYERDYKEGKL